MHRNGDSACASYGAQVDVRVHLFLSWWLFLPPPPSGGSVVACDDVEGVALLCVSGVHAAGIGVSP